MKTMEQQQSGRVLDVPCDRIRPMPGQPRRWFDPKALQELADSLATAGQIVPAIVTAVADDLRHDYEIVDGERRWRAARIAGLPTLRVQVVPAADADQRFQASVIANCSRRAVTPLELAEACGRMKRTMTVERIAATVGLSTQSVYDHLALLNLAPDLRELMHPATEKARRIGYSVAVRLAKITPELQMDAYRDLQARGSLNVVGASDLLQKHPATTVKPRPQRPADRLAVLMRRLARFRDETQRDADFGRLAARLDAKTRAKLRLEMEEIRSLMDARLAALAPAKEASCRPPARSGIPSPGRCSRPARRVLGAARKMRCDRSRQETRY